MTTLKVNKFQNIFSSLGPGLLMAGAAIGVSHLVQATRAGANYGLQLLIIVLLVNLFKYPFFEYGHRYTSATGEDLLTGYARFGRFFLTLFLLLNFITAVTSLAAVFFVTAALASNLLGGGHSLLLVSLGLMLFCFLLIMVGRYKWLDWTMKILMVILFITTVSAFGMALLKGTLISSTNSQSVWTFATLPFIIALMGWMPAPVEVSVWQSLWLKAKMESSGKIIDQKSASIDFNFGYSLTVILAVLFLGLGALVMHGKGVNFSSNAVVFMSQIVELYTNCIGSWSQMIIALAAFTTMFSTSLTVIDAYPRSLSHGSKLLLPKITIKDSTWHQIWILFCSVLALLIIAYFLTSLKSLVDLVTTISFLSAPIFSYMNFKLITSKYMPEKYRPSSRLRILSYLGISYFTLFGILFLIFKITY